MMKRAFTISLGKKIGQLRAAPVELGDQGEAILLCHCRDFDVDPYSEMFYFPTDTLKMTMISLEGHILWQRDLGRGVVPGLWFCPFLPLDLNGDGVDEIYYVDNENSQHPLTSTGYCVSILDGRTGNKIGTMPWPDNDRNQCLSHRFRNFLIGGRTRSGSILVTAQGTYDDMHLQGWSSSESCLWRTDIAADDPGARGSHMTALSRFHGEMEVMWGERCLRLEDGEELFCADRDTWNSHSDVALPVRDHRSGKWYFYTCREGDNDVSPRVALYDDRGNRLWGRLDQGHIDMGWAARDRERGPIFGAVRIGQKSCGPDGRFHQNREEFLFDLQGEPIEPPFSLYHALPVDLTGSGFHDFAFTQAEGGLILDGAGKKKGETRGTPALVCSFLDRPGEHILSYSDDGSLSAWYDDEARDSPDFIGKKQSDLYRYNRKLGGTGYNVTALCGL